VKKKIHLDRQKKRKAGHTGSQSSTHKKAMTEKKQQPSPDQKTLGDQGTNEEPQAEPQQTKDPRTLTGQPPHNPGG
jgi:hypothetical protein